MSAPDLQIELAGLIFKNPVLLASGTVGYGYEISNFLDLNQVGGIVTKSISLNPRKGNPPQRIVETASGMLNAIGLANVGVEEFITEKLPFLSKFDTKVICNIAASSVSEYVECVRTLTTEETIDAFEINVSCPNVKDGGLIFGNDLNFVGEICDKVKSVSNKPVIIKLSPNSSDIGSFAKVAKENGADAVSAINTLVGTAFNIWTRKPKIFNITGGLSGPAIKPVALAKVLEISRKCDIPIIGIGGITVWEDVVEFMIAGASLIQLGTVNFVHPDAANKIVSSLEDYCRKIKINKINSIIASYELN